MRHAPVTRSWAILAGSVVLALTAAGLVSATIPGPDGAITACYTLRSGAVRIVDANQVCSKTEARLTWPTNAVKAVEVRADGHLVLTQTDGTTADLGPVPAVRDATVDATRHLVLTYTDATTKDLGDVQGPPGPPLGSLDALAGLPCNGGAGVTVVTYGAGLEAPVTLTCRRAAAAVRVWIHRESGDPGLGAAVALRTGSGEIGTCGTYESSDCTYDLPLGTVVEARIVPGPFGMAGEWGGACLGVPSGDACTVTVTGPTTIEVVTQF